MKYMENDLLNRDELERYSRQILLPGFGLEAQQKLKAAKVLVVGCGGLGSPLLLYLAAAGIGHLGLVDHDVVDVSNLQRQVLFNTDDLGSPKAKAAAKHLQRLNPHLQLTVYCERLQPSNARVIFSGYDLIADCSDNFPTRYLINDAAVLEGLPVVFASVFRFQGQVAVFNHSETEHSRGPDYRDLFPTPPPLYMATNCADGGVLGVLPGIIGSIQANEVLKIITGIGEVLNGRMYIFDALTMMSRILNIQKRKERVPITELIDYEEFCMNNYTNNPIKEITIEEYLQWKKQNEITQLVDVREPYEFEQINMGGHLIPLGEITQRNQEVSRTGKVVLYCKAGVRSAVAIQELQNQFGFDNLYNLRGGILAYLQEKQKQPSI